MHCHIDMSNFTDTQIVNIIKNFILQQKKIKKDFVILKSRLTSNAQYIPKNMLKILTPFIVKRTRKKTPIIHRYSYLSDRYYMLNLQSLNQHNTLEFRLSNGTVQFRKIRHYIKWCLEFCIKYANKEVR